ncbi:hypothetical protein [uncultured Aquimarina sp.]|uniref:hypothetical protein n=1 Tax=uncultured Aquimarina sp. TaxID=575652 RepID=UPI0026141E00|nr:hypothetical protein [uncultured Aquimarina sp.]
MSVFNPYLNVIKKAIKQDPKLQQRLFSATQEDSAFDTSYIKALRNELPNPKNINESVNLIKGMGTSVVGDLPKLGNHPDFKYLRYTDESEDHWIISGFIDVKDSTKLFNRFTKATVALITEGIVQASIFAVNLCDGYVHRIQGDGLMVYFGGKNKDKAESVKNALKAFAMISYFVKNDLKDFFAANSVTEIYTRAGLDLGHNSQVRWLYSGSGDAGEVTTCSLHTSLAPKMQSNAVSNGVVVGQNIVTQITTKQYFKKKRNPIWEYGDGRTYDQYDFNWEKYIIDKGIGVQDRYGNVILTIGETKQKQSLNKINLVPIAQISKPYFD